MSEEPQDPTEAPAPEEPSATGDAPAADAAAPDPGSEDEPRAPLDIPEPGLPIAKIDYLYRIFCAKKEMPDLDTLLQRLIADNPHNPPGSFIFAPPNGMRRLQDALGASKDYFVMGYLRDEAPQLWEEAAAALEDQGRMLDEPERLAVRKAPLCIVIRAQIDNPENNEFIETLMQLADAFRDLCHGVVWDVYMRRILGNREWSEAVRTVLSPLSHIRVVTRPGGGFVPPPARLRTAGLRKFGSPDLELCQVPLDSAADTSNFLLDACEHLMQGDLLEPDDVVTYRDTKIRFVEGPPPAEGENGTLRIVDAPLDPEADFPDTDGTEGAPRLIEAIQAARIEVEGQRACGGLGAS